MTHYVLELGFDNNMAKIHGSDRYQPLQYGLRFGEGGDPNTGRWLTTLQPGDKIRVAIFDITQLSGAKGPSGYAPDRLVMQFVDVISGHPAPAPPFENGDTYGGSYSPSNGILQFDADQLAAAGEPISYVFGRGGKTIRGWALVDRSTGDPVELVVANSCLKLSMVLHDTAGSTYAFDPEWVVDPYGGG